VYFLGVASLEEPRFAASRSNFALMLRLDIVRAPELRPLAGLLKIRTLAHSRHSCRPRLYSLSAVPRKAFPRRSTLTP
jgi:hypothetical protein